MWGYHNHHSRTRRDSRVGSTKEHTVHPAMGRGVREGAVRWYTLGWRRLDAGEPSFREGILFKCGELEYTTLFPELLFFQGVLASLCGISPRGWGGGVKMVGSPLTVEKQPQPGEQTHMARVDHMWGHPKSIPRRKMQSPPQEMAMFKECVVHTGGVPTTYLAKCTCMQNANWCSKNCRRS